MSVRRMRWLFILLCVGVSACWTDENGPGGGSHGDPNCNDLLCEDALAVYVARRDAEIFVPGEYLFSLGPEEPGVTCTIPTKGALSCQGDTNSIAVSLNQTNDLFTLRFDAAPRQIYIEVMLNGALIGSESLIPSYQVITSDNPDCYDTCMQGDATLTVQDPPSE